MARIIAIEKEGRRFTVHTEEGAPALLDRRTLEEAGLHIGDEIEPGELERLERLSQLRLAREKALDAVARREMCRAGVLRLLKRGGTPDEVAALVTDELEARGLVNDERYAAMAAEYLYESKRWGFRRVVMELRMKGVDSEIAEAAAQEHQPDPAAVLDGLLEGRMGRDTDTPEGFRRVMGNLMRRGFEAGDIRAAIRRQTQD